MIQSMTGYGKSVVEYDGKKINIEIKSLNSKALDIQTRIAPLYREKDIEMRQMISMALERGKVDFCIWIEKDAEADLTPINAKLMGNYYRQAQEISKEIGIAVPNDLMNTLLRLPDMLCKNEVEKLNDDEWTAVQEGIRKALDDLVAYRIQEGVALQKKFEEKLNNIAVLMKQIEPYEQSRVEKIRARITEGLKSIPEVEYDKNRLEQELIYYIEKLDISEEKQRLANHLDYFRATMNDEHAQGKKLGFIAQEMGREINTTGSKSNQAEMQNIVVKMKDELEQIKEQVLNTL